MEEKKYRIVNNFTDAYTGERYTRNHEPIPFSDERVDEIRKVEKIQGYPLIEEIDGEPENGEPNEDTTEVTEETDETPVVEDGEPENGEPNEDTTEVTEETDETLVFDDNKKSNKKNKKN